MKKKLFCIMGVLGVLLALGFVLAGCGTTGGSVPPPVPDKQVEDAAQLAAELNAMNEGCAVVEGETVRFSGEVYLTTGLAVPAGVSLIVPAGVTLDLTTDGASLTLREGATLTVDGTVEASGHGDQGKGWVEGGLRIGDGTTIINGSGTIRLRSKGHLLNIWGDNGTRRRHLTLDGVTLVGIADNTHPLVQVGGGGELVLKSGAITGNTRDTSPGASATSGGGVQVDNGSAFTMTGGEISGNSAFHGSGVNVYEKSTFTMEGGTISGNTAGNATVSVWAGSTFTMKSGAITGNEGRGVFVNGTTSTFIMDEGDISGNGCGQGADGGQGVAVNQGTFTMKGGAIYGNAFTSREGGGVFIVGDALFEMYGGRIQGNKDSDGFTRNINNRQRGAALENIMSRTKWGTGGSYTKGGVSQTGGSEIAPLKEDGRGGTDDTLIAIPAK
jgi:hypothetical protein